MKLDKIKVGFISDIHLFHARTPTKKIVEELKTQFNSKVKDIDILFFGGDVFDKSQALPKEVVVEAFEFIHYILKWSKETDTQLRILEGTPSHDWKQARWFEHVNENASIHADIKYFPELTIEYNERYDIHVLYVPDEWDPDTSETYRQVKTILDKKGLDKVDLAIMHGNFRYQLPEIAKAPKHVEEDYLNIVRYYISIGHVHKPSTYDRILAQGSFSRLAHNEEEDKGYILANLYKDGNMDYKFIINKEATKYISIDISYMTAEQGYNAIKRVIKRCTENDHLRLVCENTNPLLKDFNNVIKLYPLYRWTTKVLEDKSKINKEIEQVLLEDYKVVTLTDTNIESQLISRLVSKGYPDKVILESERLLKEVLKDVL